MDPVSATAAVVAAVCAIAGAVNSVQLLRERHKIKKAVKEALGTGPNASDVSIPTSAFNLSVEVNYLVAKFGKEFGTESGGESSPMLTDVGPFLG